MYSESVDFYHCFMYILSMLASFVVIFSHTFHVRFCSQIFNCFLVQKRCPKSTQNDPKFDPSASQGGVWLPGSIRSFLDMPFLRFLMPKWHQKVAKNVPVEAPLAPRTIEISRFSPKCRFGGVLAPFCNFRRTYLTQFWKLRALFQLMFCQRFELFFKDVTGVGGSIVFQITLFRIKTFLQHQNL